MLLMQVLKTWIDCPNTREWDGAVYNAAIVTLHIFHAFSNSSQDQFIDLAAVARASFSPLFISPSPGFWGQLSENQMMPTDGTGRADTESPQPPADTLTTLFVLSGIYLHRGLRRAWDYLEAYRHTSPRAASAAESDDGVLKEPRLWILAAEWCSVFGQALSRQNELGGVTVAILPTWMFEVGCYDDDSVVDGGRVIICMQIVCFVMDGALQHRSTSSSFEFSPSSITSDAVMVCVITILHNLRVQQSHMFFSVRIALFETVSLCARQALASAMGCQHARQGKRSPSAVLSCSSPHLRSQCVSLLKRKFCADSPLAVMAFTTDGAYVSRSCATSTA
jgi:hypothetical protein